MQEKQFEMWTEKHRPRDFSELAGQEQITKRLAEFAKIKSLPHMMFSGPAGCGKTTAALIMARLLFGDAWKHNFLDLNASDERGIDVIRSKVKEFARTKSLGAAPFKLIFLDEADALTNEAQNALRRTMENYTNTARFIISCNYSSKIIEPIQSRCAVFRFKPLNAERIENRLSNIATKENLKINKNALEAAAELAEGDMRKAVNILQAAATTKTEISEDDIFEIASRAKPKEIGVMLANAAKGDFKSARENLKRLVIEQGLSGRDIISGIHRQVFDLDVPERAKIAMLEKVGECEFRLSEGCDEIIQLEALLAQFALFSERPV
ncbi:MAG: replication factor C small subunit [Candidatus Aenigmarchaeota archaeon]|nr:replication factor C small subunit [Candidatus Aenigmarchaeota archaeon]